jgi:hypothetical protein
MKIERAKSIPRCALTASQIKDSTMKLGWAFLIFAFLGQPLFAQTKRSLPSSSDPDRLGQTCARILQMSSNEWIVYFEGKSGLVATNHPNGIIRAVAAYGKCYDERTKRLAATLGKSGKGPLMGANGNLRDFESALDNFTVKALAATNTADDSQKSAYARLYEKQFHYEFYQNYSQKNLLARPLTPEESDEFAKAKNHFGEILGLLPDAQLHAVHAAFRQIFDVGPVSDVTKLELYRFAIFLLAPAKDKPFSPPPF